MKAKKQTATIENKNKNNSVLRRFLKNKLSAVGMIILLMFILIALLAPVIAPYDYKAIDPINANVGPCSEHLFGTDIYGRDMLSRMIYGARYSLAIGICSQLLATIVGFIFGTLAGYFGGVVDEVILRITDIFQAIPSILLAIVISQALGSGFIQTVIALSLGGIPMSIRMLRSTILTVRTQEYVEAAKILDCSPLRVMVVHILPNCLAPQIVTASLGVGRMLMTSSGLSYLGLGVQEPSAEWGAMLSLAKGKMRYYPYQVFIPGIAIAVLILSFNLIGDGLRDALDPKLRS